MVFLTAKKAKSGFAVLVTGCLVAAFVVIAGCGEDDPVKPEPTPKIQFKDLSQKDDALFNLELAYNERHLAECDKLLDDDFLFYFADYDVAWRGAPEYWDRVMEVLFTSKLLDPDAMSGIRIISIDLQLEYPDTSWSEEAAPPSHEGETWFSQIVPYDLKVRTADNWEFHSVDQSIEITIRRDESAGHWRIVTMRDGMSVLSAQQAPSLGPEPVYWGTLKAGFWNVSRP